MSLKILSVGILSGLGLKLSSSRKGLYFLLVGTVGHFKLNLACSLWSTQNSGPHTHKTSGMWLKILRGSFPCLQFHPQLRLKLTTCTPSACEGSSSSLGPHGGCHHSRALAFHMVFLHLHIPSGLFAGIFGDFRL